MRSIAVAFTLLLTLALGAQDLPDAGTITKQVQEASKQRKSIEYVKQITGEVTLDGKPVTEITALGRRIPVQSSIGKQTVALHNPGKARIDLQLGGGGSLLVSDGDTTWTYRPSTKAYTKVAAAQTAEGTAANLAVLDVLGFFADTKTTKTARQESITIDGTVYDCWVLTSSVKLPAQAGMGGQVSDGVMTSWVDKKLLFEVQEEIAYTVKVAPANGAAPLEYRSKIIQVAHNLKVDQPVDGTLFAYTPPPDAREQAPQIAGRVDLTGKDAPSFRGVSLDGKVYSSEELKGKPVLLDFWASWCGPCRESFPFMNELQSALAGKGLHILAVSVDKTAEEARGFLARYPAKFATALDTAGACPAAFRVEGMPSSYIIGRDGVVRAVHVGFRGGDKAEIRRQLDEALSEAK